MLAVLSRAPVVPVYVHGSGRAWPKGRRLPRPAKISVYFGPALALPRSEGGERRDHYETASRAIMAAIAALKERATAAGCADAPSPLKYTQGRNGQHGHG
jgi:1-acyl-sn-glycerol-3-phosphate acyltransferase